MGRGGVKIAQHHRLTRNKSSQNWEALRRVKAVK